MRRNSSEDTLLGKSRLNSTSDKSAQFAAIICNTFWGMSFLASRVTLNYAPVIVILSHRFLLAFLLMSLLLPTRYGHLRFRGRAIWPLLLLGLLEPVLYYIGEIMTIKIGVVGYGNLGKGVENAVRLNKDIELVAIFTRRDGLDWCFGAACGCLCCISIYAAQQKDFWYLFIF